MSFVNVPFTGDLWSRWVGVGKTCCINLSEFRAVASPAKLSCIQRTRANIFQRLFVMELLPLILPLWFVPFQSESGVLVF